MIRVLHVIDHLGLGGAQSAVLDLLGNMDREHFHCEVAVLHGQGPFADALRGIGITVHSLSPSKWPPLYIPGLLALLRQSRFDILHFHLQGANWLAKPLSALAGNSRRIAHDHASADLHFRGYRSLLPDSLSHLLSDRVIAVSPGVRSFLELWEAVPADKISIVRNGVDTTLFSPATEHQKAAARAALGLPADTFVVGTMGRLAPEKHHILMVELAGRNPGMTFVIGGTGPEEGRLKEAAAKLPPSADFRLFGNITQRPQFYHALDAFILPSLHEALPMAVLEAMASGIPVLASDLEGINEALLAGRAGLLAPAGDVDAFERHLHALRDAISFRESIKVEALRRVRADYSARETARRMQEIYRMELALADKLPADK